MLREHAVPRGVDLGHDAELESLVIIDESHMLSKSAYKHIKLALARMPHALCLTFSATPVKLLGEKIYRYGIGEAIREGRLAPYYVDTLEPSGHKRLDVLLAAQAEHGGQQNGDCTDIVHKGRHQGSRQRGEGPPIRLGNGDDADVDLGEERLTLLE